MWGAASAAGTSAGSRVHSLAAPPAAGATPVLTQLPGAHIAGVAVQSEAGQYKGEE